MHEDKEDKDIYGEEGREELIEDEDEITNIEEGFMKGYDEEEKLSECCNCGKVLVKEEVVEEEFDGVVYRFCSPECASEFEKNREL